MMLAISYAVMMRYAWNQTVPWIVEISSYLMLYITFLGTAWLQRKGGHVELDLLTAVLNPGSARVSRLSTSLGGAVVGFVLAWKALWSRWTIFRGVIAIGILNTPQFLLMGIIPIGGFCSWCNSYSGLAPGQACMKGTPAPQGDGSAHC